MFQYFRVGLTKLGVFASHPIAFIIVFCYVAAWLALNPETFDWHAVATVATWFMTLIIQRAEHRDTQAIHARLDELLRVDGNARSELTRLEEQDGNNREASEARAARNTVSTITSPVFTANRTWAEWPARNHCREGTMPFYEKGDVRIRYQEAGRGFPLLCVPGGGLNSRMSNWPNAVFNSFEIFSDEFHCITMDQRNANGGESTGPIPTSNPWDAFADDQLGLMDHLGIKQFLFIGYCIGGCFAGKLMERAPDRVVGTVFCQTVGHRPEDPTVMYRHSSSNWVPDFRKRRPDVSTDTIERYLHDLYAAQPDFLHSVSRDFISSCQTPMLVLPDDTDSHPLQTSIQVASLAPNAEITVFPWREPAELKQRTIGRVRKFLRENRPEA